MRPSPPEYSLKICRTIAASASSISRSTKPETSRWIAIAGAARDGAGLGPLLEGVMGALSRAPGRLLDGAAVTQRGAHVSPPDPAPSLQPSDFRALSAVAPPLQLLPLSIQGKKTTEKGQGHGDPQDSRSP